jgi:hypothetical protein
MLDECREIWVSTCGPDQPMTQVDVRTWTSVLPRCSPPWVRSGKS